MIIYTCQENRFILPSMKHHIQRGSSPSGNPPALSQCKCTYSATLPMALGQWWTPVDLRFLRHMNSWSVGSEVEEEQHFGEPPRENYIVWVFRITL